MRHARGGRFGWAAWLCLLGALPAGCGKTEEAAPVPGPGKGGDSLAEARERSKENLKRIGAAFRNYESVFHYCPNGLINPKTGQLWLSWRVQLLPFLEDADARELSKQFRLGEPWDSDHNKALLAKMPKVYAPVRGKAPPGYTFYQGFANHYLRANGKEIGPKEFGPFRLGAFSQDPRTYFPPREDPHALGVPVSGPRFTDIIDGTSNTFLVVEAGEAVPWSKPQDIPFRFDVDDATKKGKFPWVTGTWPKLGGMFDGDFHALMVDATTIYYIKKDAPVDKLRPFITFADGIIPDYPGIGLEEPEFWKQWRQKKLPKAVERKDK
jgi:hypothetical protein